MNKYFVLILLSCINLNLFAQFNNEKKKKSSKEKPKAELDKGVRVMGQRVNYYSSWTSRGAKPVPLYEVQFSAFTSTRWGNFPKTEISSYLPLLPIIPNIAFKHHWLGEYTMLSSQHSFNYPSMLLRVIRNKGVFNSFSKETEIPNIFTFRNEIILSRILNKKIKQCFYRIPDLVLSLRLGFDMSLSDKKNYFPDINNAIVFCRTNAYREHRPQYFLGAELAGNLYKSFNFSAIVDYYTVRIFNDYALESKLNIIWHKSTRLSFSLGCMMAYTNANINKKFSIIPMANIIFKIRHEQTLERGLF